MTGAVNSASRHHPWLAYAVIGVLAGLLSGLFGVGGGVLIVPALIYVARLSPKLAAGTSLLAIMPVAVVGFASYATTGSVDYASGIALAVGAIVGAQLGSWLLARLSQRAVRIGFICFMLVVIGSLFVVVPDRAAEVETTPLTLAGLAALGVATGVCSGLLGIGGGVIIVPMLELLFGASDLVAKGTSLFMMIFTGASGTVANIRRGQVHVPAAIGVGVSAAIVTPLGAWLARLIAPGLANMLFAGFLAIIAVKLVIDTWGPKTRRAAADSVATAGTLPSAEPRTPTEKRS